MLHEPSLPDHTMSSRGLVSVTDFFTFLVRRDVSLSLSDADFSSGRDFLSDAGFFFCFGGFLPRLTV